MSNIRGLFSDKKKDRDSDDNDSDDDGNNRFVGGIGDRGGGRYVASCVLDHSHSSLSFSKTLRCALYGWC